MKVLMFGWEFPPYISGGLGTACYGLSAGLVHNGVEVTFVLPTKKRQNHSNEINIIGADEIPLISGKELLTGEIANLEKINWIKVPVGEKSISPYYANLSFKDFFGANKENAEYVKFLSSLSPGSILSFTGDYGPGLFSEVMNYGLVGASLGVLSSFDVIHAHDWLTYPAGVRAKQMSGKPLVIHVHATEYDRSGYNMNREVYNIEKYGMDAADKIIAVSYYTKNILMHKYHIPEEKIAVVHNAIDKQRQLDRYGLKKPLKEKIVLFLGRVTMQKGPDYFIEAAHLVIKKVKEVRFVMAGSGDLLPRMIDRMAALKIADKFHFTGFLRGHDVEKMYAMSDLYVMPSVSEPFGLTAFEALMYDVPIILSKQSGVAELLPDAIKVDFWDIQKLADKMIALLTDEELKKQTVERCQKSLEKIEWNTAGYKIKMVYQDILRR